jgi:hypothetical protein
MINLALRKPKHLLFRLSLLSLLGHIGLIPFGYAQESYDGTVSDTIASLSITPVNVAINAETCNDIAETEEFTLSGAYNTPSIVVSYTVRLIATTGSSCTHEDVCNDVALDEGGCSCLKEVSNTSSASTSFTIADLFDEPCVDGEERTISFFLHYTETESDPLLGLNPLEEESQAIKLSIDLNPPPPPEDAPTVVPAEEALVINAPEVGGDVVKYEACVWLDDTNREEARCKEIMSGSGDRFEGLSNDLLYNVIYGVYDDANNRSGDSPTAQGAPASVLDFAEVYSGEYPGGERGGCQSSTHGVSQLFLGILLSILIMFSRRFRTGKTIRYIVTVALFSSYLFSSRTVEARPMSNESSRSSTVQFSGGAYLPSIDDEFLPQEGIKRPYERVFENQSPLMFQVQLERHLIQNKGTLSIGGSFGYWSVEGEGLSVTTVSETTELSMLPMSIYGAYRFDFFQKSMPIVPVIKAGMSYYSWTIYNGAGDIAQFNDGSEASGGTLGWFYSIGVHFLLDFLDPEMAWAFDRDAGVNHSFLTFEYQSSQVDDFGDPDSFRLGNDVYFFGIALDI